MIHALQAEKATTSTIESTNTVSSRGPSTAPIGLVVAFFATETGISGPNGRSR